MNSFKFQEFKSNGEMFFNSLLKDLSHHQIDVQSLKSDHLCFRVQTEQEYVFYKNGLKNQARLLTETIVNGRPIATYKLHQSFNTSIGPIDLVELPFPKPGTEYRTGFEHAEFVIQESFSSFQNRHPKINFTIGGNKNINPELCLKTASGQAKFHPLPLNRVIEIEEADITDIVFDFDGTLIQSREQIYQINSLVFSEVCQRPVSIQEAKEKFSPEFAHLFSFFEISHPKDQALALERWGTIACDFEYPLFNNVENLLATLLEKNLRLHLWTARDEISTKKILKALNITDYFTTLSFANSIQSKPHPGSLNFDWQAAKEHSIVMIGDSPTDIKGAQNINAISAAALWDPYADIDKLAHSGAELFFHEISEFHQWVK
jgi:uncharacterized protein